MSSVDTPTLDADNESDGREVEEPHVLFASPNDMSTRCWFWFLAIEATLVSVGVVALVALALFGLPLYFSVNLIALPSLGVAVWFGIRERRLHHHVAVNRLLTGVVIGVPATVAYDIVRWILRASGAIGFDPFLSHPIFGSLILDRPVESTASIIVGWLYHFWNGLSFAAVYTIVAGRARVRYAIGWALALEIGWLAALPGALNFELSTQLIVVSVVGHIAYGIVLGLAAQRWVKA